MCLEAIETLAAPDKRVLDLGCGSGILSIGALVLGCKEAVGCDIDPKAPDVAMDNAAANAEAAAGTAARKTDAAVDAAYALGGGKKAWKNDAERVAFLFELYQRYTSLLPAENDAVVAHFLAAHPDFTLLSPSDILRKMEIVLDDDPKGDEYFRLSPHRHATDGFFAAVMERQ